MVRCNAPGRLQIAALVLQAEGTTVEKCIVRKSFQHTEIFEVELPKSENTHGARTTHVVSNVCVCVCSCVCVCVCVCVRAYWYASVYRNPHIHVHPPHVRATLRAFIKLWCGAVRPPLC